jgi:RHS repeat-associated protein
MSTVSDVISLPQGGGALNGIGEKFAPDLQTGTGNHTLTIDLPSGRNGLQPKVNLLYSTGNGNGPFGLGWSLNIPGVTRRTKGVPRYEGQDIFILSGAEDLVPITGGPPGAQRYRPRTESLFARIDRHRESAGDYWNVWTRDGLVSVYGTPRPANADASWRDPAAVANPDRRDHIFAWKLSRTTDTFGNRIDYVYERDSIQNDGPHRWDQLYLSQIRYVDYGDPAQPQFLVTINFTYEQRPDPFSDYRPGFEIRTARRCTRIDISTHSGIDLLVRTYHLAYLDQASEDSEQLPLNNVSLLREVRVEGHDGTQSEWLPPLEFSYTRFQPERRDFFPITGPDLPPGSLARPDYELVDLFGNGLPDVLQMNGTVRYWRNLGDGKFDLPREMSEAPAGLALADPGVQIVDANGDGRADLMVTSQDLTGYYPMALGGMWDRRSFHRYRVAPSFDLKDADVRLLDLDGDGVTDAIRSGRERLECFFNDPHEGWNGTRWVDRRSLDGFPNSFADPCVKWADMTGDGLQDAVLIHDGSVDYWPALGYGNWGSRITMRNSPRLPHGHDPRRILIGDVDGDGAADMVYVDGARVMLWINQSGNGWSDPIEIEGTPPVTDMDDVRLADMLGTGMSGLLWSIDEDIFGRARMFFHDFTSGAKPYLLSEADNHIGAVTLVDYRPSTFYQALDHQRPETRWKTPLPFPAQVVARVERIDRIYHRKTTNEFRYHHGYWDGVEGEFRGFARVDLFDSEGRDDVNLGEGKNSEGIEPVPPGLFSPPTETRTWFHVGAVDEKSSWHELDLTKEFWEGDHPLLNRPTPTVALLKSLPPAARRDALRALRGTVIRTESYSRDGSARADRPYTVSEYVSGLLELDSPDPAQMDRKRIFFPHTAAERSTRWERGDEPMTAVQFIGDHDIYGQPRSRISIAVPRIPGEPYLATLIRTAYAQRDDDERYIVDRVARETTCELVNDGSGSIENLRTSVEDNPTGWPVIGLTLTYYDGQAYIGLPIGALGNHGALVRQKQLVLTEQQLHEAYASAEVLDPPEKPPYLIPEGSTSWTTDYPLDFRVRLPELAGYAFHSGGDEVEQLRGYFAEAERRRYDFHEAGKGRGLITTTRDSLGHEMVISYDDFALLPVAVTDAGGLVTAVEHDYRVFQPHRVTDPNGNLTLFTFNPLALLATKAVMGREDEPVGDRPDAPSLRLLYDFHDFSEDPLPISVRTIWQMHHINESDVPQPEREQTIESVRYSDGFSRILQTRSQAEDVIFGDAVFGGSSLPTDQSVVPGDAVRSPVEPTATPRVRVSGWQIYDNKGRVVEKYEPFFSVGWGYGRPTESELGEKTTFEYDALGRLTRTVYSDESEERVVHGVPADLADPDRVVPTPWETYTYDSNDNAGRTHPVESAGYAAQWDTPASVVVDALGRAVETRVMNEHGETFRQRSTYDIRGNVVTVTDELGRVVFRHNYDLTNRQVRTESLDGGLRRWVFDAAGNVVERHDSKGALALYAYDVLNRPVRVWARDEATSGPTLRERLEYGDGGDPAQSTDERQAQRQSNRLGRLHRHYDEAGLVTIEAYDFRGNSLERDRQVVRDDAILAEFVPAPLDWEVQPFQMDWEASPPTSFDEHAATLLDSVNFRISSTYDALNRVKRVLYPKDVEGVRRELRPTYSGAGALQRVTLDGETFVERIAYDAKGQRTLVAYGNGILTRYAYERKTFRLARMRSERYKPKAELVYHPIASNVPIQDIGYGYDRVGNMIRIIDRTGGCGVVGNPDQFGADQVLAGLLGSGDALVRRFAYDGLYRLTSATGRECKAIPAPRPWSDNIRWGYDSGNLGTPNQDNAPNMTAIYTEKYGYDPAGNLVSLKHTQNGKAWTRSFGAGGLSAAEWSAAWAQHLDVDTPWLNAPGNRPTNVQEADSPVQTHFFDGNGNLVGETTSRHCEWDHADHMRVFRTQTAGAEPSVYAHYLYDSSGSRVKKIVRKQGGGTETTVYIDGIFERTRLIALGSSIESDTVHIMDDRARIATFRSGPPLPDDMSPGIQFHLADHLGSSHVVVSDDGGWVNREEYTPYGETSLGSFARKRFRFTGKERDWESGFNYHTARYYAPWLMRWVSCDPVASRGGTNQYAYCSNQPTRSIDLQGTQPSPAPGREPPDTATMDPAYQEALRDPATFRWDRWKNMSEEDIANEVANAVQRPAEAVIAEQYTRVVGETRAGPLNQAAAARSRPDYEQQTPVDEFLSHTGLGLFAFALEAVLATVHGTAEAMRRQGLDPEALMVPGLMAGATETMALGAESLVTELETMQGGRGEFPLLMVIPLPKNATRLGVARNTPEAWSRLADLWSSPLDPEGTAGPLSSSNLWKITNRISPRVDKHWIQWFPEHEAYRGEVIEMHHVGGLPFQVPLTETEHYILHGEGHYRTDPGWLKTLTAPSVSGRW